MSVSMLTSGMGAAIPVSFSNLSMGPSLGAENLGAHPMHNTCTDHAQALRVSAVRRFPFDYGCGDVTAHRDAVTWGSEAPRHHAGSRVISRTSVRRPVTAAAAAMAGDIRCVRPPRP